MIRKDITAAWPKASRARKVWYFATEPGLRAVARIRVQIALEIDGMTYVARWVRLGTVRRYGIDWVSGARCGPGLIIRHPYGIVVGHGARLGSNVNILQGATIGERIDRAGTMGYPTLEDGVTVGAGAAVLGAVTIGTLARIGANSVVLKDVPPSGTVVGVPGRIVT